MSSIVPETLGVPALPGTPSARQPGWHRDPLGSLVPKLLALFDPAIALFLVPSLYVLRTVRRIGAWRLPVTERTLLGIGVFPMRDHYYEPLFNPAHLKRDLGLDRPLPALSLNLAGARALLRSFRYGAEFHAVLHAPQEAPGVASFAMGNRAFESGDADIWYSMIRHFRPRRIVEIGSGHSTLVARAAIRRNQAEDPAYRCEHVCIEPYENAWLEDSGARVLRSPVEEVPPAFFHELGENDVLFIDSSHVIRPQGDVLFEYLELLPALRKGVIVHIHDIFTPRDYLPSWAIKEKRFWNEQYLVEAFLSFNSAYEVLLPLNHLHHHAYSELAAACADYSPAREPGSLYIRRI